MKQSGNCDKYVFYFQMQSGSMLKLRIQHRISFPTFYPQFCALGLFPALFIYLPLEITPLTIISKTLTVVFVLVTDPDTIALFPSCYWHVWRGIRGLIKLHKVVVIIARTARRGRHRRGWWWRRRWGRRWRGTGRWRRVRKWSIHSTSSNYRVPYFLNVVKISRIIS